MGAGRVRARRGSGSIRVRNGRLLAQVSLGTDPSGRRVRRGKTFDSRTHAEAWIARQQLEHGQLTNPVTDEWLADYLRWWLAVQAPKGKPGRRPLARTTLAQYRVIIERHLISDLGNGKVGQLTVRELDAFASRKLAAGYAPATVNRMRETLRSALSTAVRQDRLIRNLARYGGGVAAPRPPVDRFTDHELAPLLKAARDEHFFPILLLLARTGLRIGEACGLHWRDLALESAPPRLTVVWQLVGRAFHRARTAAGVDHGNLKTFRSTVATQLAEAGLHPSKTQAFLGHAHVTTTLTYYTAITDVDEAADLLPDLH
jgi:integrase